MKDNGILLILGMGLLGGLTKSTTATTPSTSSTSNPIMDLSTTVLSVVVPQGNYVNPNNSPPLATDRYDIRNTSMGDLQANIAWAVKQGYRLTGIETVKSQYNPDVIDWYIGHMER